MLRDVEGKQKQTKQEEMRVQILKETIAKLDNQIGDLELKENEKRKVLEKKLDQERDLIEKAQDRQDIIQKQIDQRKENI